MERAADAALLEAVERALTGLNGSATRLTPLDRHNLFAPLTEFCWWAISADEALDRVLGEDVYRPARDADDDGGVAGGLRYVRNALGHEQLVATFTEGGLTFPITFPITIAPIEVRWLPVNEVVTRKVPSKNDLNLRAAYERNVAGRPVEETLYEARRWLERADRWARIGDLLPR